jgi:hypothetical protein
MKTVALVIAFVVVGVGGYSLGRWQSGRAVVEVKAPVMAEVEVVKTNPIVRAVTPKGVALVAAGTAVDRGYAAAQLDLEGALRELEKLNAAERGGFVTGIFSYAARNLPPAEGLKLSQRLAPELKQTAWRTLVGEWIYARSPLDEENKSKMRDAAFTSSGGRQGLLVELSGLLAGAKPDAELTSAWLDAFSDGTARSEMLATLAPTFGRENVDALLKRTDGWTAWEKERVGRRFLSTWAYENPQEAWDWYQKEKGRFDGDLSSSIFMAWGTKDSAGARRLLDTVNEPSQRETLLNIIGRTMAMQNTDAAVAWADGLANARDREIAHKGVYDGAPRGVGAVLDFQDGFPMLRAIVAGSPLDGSGIKPGDRLVEVREADGARRPLYGADLQAAVDMIRGEPGSQMTLRILRKNGGSGALEEHMIPVTRAQLYLNEASIPKP